MMVVTSGWTNPHCVLEIGGAAQLIHPGIAEGERHSALRPIFPRRRYHLTDEDCPQA